MAVAGTDRRPCSSASTPLPTACTNALLQSRARAPSLLVSVAEFFDEEGVFYEDKCMDMTRQFLDHYERESKRIAEQEPKKAK
jgi:hypothetical protein